MPRILLQPASLILIAANLVPLIGVMFWGWDAFVLLMLYWLETAIIAFWTIMRIGSMPAGALGDLRFEGSDKKTASPVAMAAFFTLHAGIFMGVHFMFLWTLFSGDWPQRIHGIHDFLDLMVIGTGLWVPLIALFIGRGALMLFDAIRPHLLWWFAIMPRDKQEPSSLSPSESLLFGLYIRIVVMQFTIIMGAWFAMVSGSTGALAFLIGVKTSVDLTFQLIATHFHEAWVKAKADEARKSKA